MFQKLFGPNRGVIARRVFRACRHLGIKTVAVYSDADRDSLHVRDADEAVAIGPPPARDSYLVIEAILRAPRDTGADAVHPGYGFLSANSQCAAPFAPPRPTLPGPAPAANPPPAGPDQ